MLNDKKRWREDTSQPVTVDKKIIVGGGYISAGFYDAQKIETLLNIFDNSTNYSDYENLIAIVHDAKADKKQKKIDTKFFSVDLFKGDRLHLTFKNLHFLKKRLPLDYGVKAYGELSEQERRLVDEYEGKNSYEELHNNYTTYNVNPFETYWNNFVNSNKYLVEIFNNNAAVNDSHCL